MNGPGDVLQDFGTLLDLPGSLVRKAIRVTHHAAKGMTFSREWLVRFSHADGRGDFSLFGLAFHYDLTHALPN